MVSLQETHPVPLQYHHSDRFAQYHTRDDVEASPPRGTMEREEPSSTEQEPKVVSVQERIRALNRTAGHEASKPSRQTPQTTKERAAAPWQVKASSTPVARSKAPMNSLSMHSESERYKSEEQSQVESFSQSRRISSITAAPNAEVGSHDSVGDRQIAAPFAKGGHVSTDYESLSSDFIADRADESAKVEESSQADRGYSNTLHQFMIDSARGDDDHQIEEFDDDIEGDFAASAAVRYWRRSKGTAGQEDESATNEDGDDGDDLHESTERQDSGVLNCADSPCGGDSHDSSLCQKFDSQVVRSDTLHETHTRTVEYMVESQPDVQSSSHSVNEVEEAVESLALGAESDPEEHTLITNDATSTTSSPAQPPVPKPLSPHSGPRMAQEHSNIDDLEEITGKAARESGEIDKSEIGGKHERRGSEYENKEKQRRHSKPAPASSLSQRAFEKRSRMRATQNVQTMIPKTKETPKDVESTAEIDNASVFSGSTTHSSTTIHTTTLSSRATRLLRDKRKGNVKTDGLAKALAQKILRGNTSENTTRKSSSEPGVTLHEEEDPKLDSQSCASGSIEQKSVNVADDHSPGKSDNSEVQLGETINACREVGADSMPGVSWDNHYSHPTTAPLVDYHFQRQISHVSQHSNTIQFGASHSFQNVEVGISSGPTVYQMQHPIPHYTNPVPATPFAAFPNADPRLYGSRRALINDLLVQPKFSRYNSFDVQNPKPPSIQNVLTEDSASWSESRTQDSAGGTQNTPQESVGPESLDHESDSAHPSSLESLAQLDSFPKGRSFDKGCTVFDHIQNACDALSPKSCNPEIVSNPTIQSNELVNVGSTFSNTLSDEDVAIEVEYVEQTEEQTVDVNSIESDSIYSLSTRDMDSRDSFSLDNA
ncbi:hypothetical protein HJC23_005911 [Cyclotella cryptica]|uniref:Uncharacterized protein n=1 Tax=Cyclotella cryptica TaxID=29204 RepID=A0ABD3QZH2_9STRA|eukprot:CCRYP_000459-RA/>CCRYP_000459-RA protein AED:0.07 eAED:0.07 QI:0/-1/0/1/-1/1/1/0/884